MPELPEVETVKEILKKQILNKKIINIDVYYETMLENTTKKHFISKLIDEEFVRIERYGKYLIFILNKCSIVSHLRMEGKFLIKDKNEPTETHEHIVFTFSDNSTLRYHDTRKFGKMALLNTTNLDEIMKYPSLSKLGLEANDNSLCGEYLYSKLRIKKMPIKTALLDQTVIAGLGNIYVDEVCHLCGLHPETPANTLSLEKCEEIVIASKKTLSKAISEGGTTIRSYTSSLGVTGRFQQHLLVHTKNTCFTCGGKVKKIRVGGRGTYYCPNCQKKNKLIIGITGVIASGKSSVCEYLKNNNYQVIDSDEIVRNLYNDKKLINNIEISFGSEYIENGQVNKKTLGNFIFNNKEKRLLLNSIIHPLVKEKIQTKIRQSKESIIFVDVPLLYEAKFTDLCDYVIVVYTNELQNIKRLQERDNIEYNDALAKIQSQMAIIDKCYLADFIIDNSFDLCYTYERLNQIINRLIK